MTDSNGATALVELLARHQVTHLFGLCGDTSLPFYDALRRATKDIRHVLARDERSAAYMADVYARLSNKVGVCEGPSGGGATYILPGLAEANDSSSPLLAITSDVSVGARGRFPLTELDQRALFKPVTAWNAMIDRAEQLPLLVRSAFRHATAPKPGAVHLGLPFDVPKALLPAAEIWADAQATQVPSRRVGANPADIERIADVLRAAERPLIVCGGGPLISGAFEQMRRLAERAAAPLATSVSGQGVIADDHPLSLGVVGSNGGTPATRAVVDEADAILFIGCRAGSVTTERWRSPAPGRATILHIDIDPSVIGVNYATAAAAVADAKLAAQALCEALGDNASADILAAKRAAAARRVSEAKRRKFAAFYQLADRNDNEPNAALRPEALVASLQRALPPDAVIVADPGTPCPYLSAYYRQRRAGRQIISNRAHGALGYSLPGVVGAQFARPDARCVAVMGDGSFGFACGELETIARYRLPVTLVVLSNASFGWIKAGQKHGFDERYFSVDFNRTDHAAVAQAFGVEARRASRVEELDAALEFALRRDGPVLIDVASQPLQDANAPVSEWIA